MPDPRDLTTLASVKALMQKSGAGAAGQDTLIQTLITRVSVKIMRDTGREFVPGGPNSETFTAATRTFEFTRGDRFDESFVDFNPYDLQKSPVPTVVIDADTTSPTTLTTDEYRLWPQPPSQGVFMAVRLQPISAAGGATVEYRNRQLQITGNWGFPSIPPEVAQAADETVVHWITNYPAARAPSQVDAAQAPSMPRSYPMPAVDLLAAFTRVPI